MEKGGTEGKEGEGEEREREREARLNVFLAYHRYLRARNLSRSTGDDATLPELSGETRGQKVA